MTLKNYLAYSAIGAFAIAVLTVPLQAQTWNSNAGGYNTGYGTVYGTFGLAQATQNMYNTMQMNMQRTMMRQAMINKWGKAAVEKAERNARSGSSSSTRNSSSAATSQPQIEVAPEPVVRNYGVYRPDSSVDTGKAIAEALGSTEDEKALIQQIYANTKKAYEQETKAKGWSNNLSGGLTFFMVSAMTVYRDTEEPSEKAVNTLYTVINQSVDQIPDFASTPNKDKQAFNNLMIGFSGLLLAGYTEGKQNQDAETLKLYSQLAGELIKMVLKIEPDRLRIKDGMIVIV